MLRVLFSDPHGPIPRDFNMKASPWPRLFQLEMEFERAFVAAGGLLVAGADPTGQDRTGQGRAGCSPGMAINAKSNCWWKRDSHRWGS